MGWNSRGCQRDWEFLAGRGWEVFHTVSLEANPVAIDGKVQ